MHRDLLGLGAGLGEDRRRAAVRGDALGRRHVVVHRRAHDRMRELERHLVVQEVGAGERRRRVACEVTLETREGCCMPELCAAAEHRDRAHEHRRLRRQARQTQRDRPRDRLGPDLRDAHRVLARRVEAFALDRVEQRLDEERIAAGRRPAGADEVLVRLPAEELARDVAHGVAAERGRPHDRRRRVGEDLGDARLVRALVGRPRRDRDEQRQALEPALEMREPAQRRAVGPVEIVDRDHRRPAQRDVRREPVEPVQHRERHVGVVLVGTGELHVVEERLRECGGPAEQLGTLVRRRGGEHRLEELPHDAVREVLLELSGACAQHRDSGLRRDRARLGEQTRLAHSRAAFDRDQPAGAGGRGVDVRVQCRELAFALEQRRPLGLRRPGARPAGAERREAVGQAFADELEDRLRPVEPGDARLAEVAELHAGLELVLDQRRRRP